jgi:hypothetical protein
MAFGNQTEQPLVAGLSSQPAVTGPANVITPDAVTALVDSFGKGVITGDDINAHSGFMAHLRDRAEAQRLQESTNPQSVAARQAALESQTANANLVTAQAGAQQAQIPAKSALVTAQNQKAQSEVWNKRATDAYLEYNPTLYKEDGSTPDVGGMAEAGRHYLRAQDALTYAGQGMASTPSKETDPTTNQPIVVQRNSMGEDVTPREDNPAYTHYRDLRQKAIETLFAPTKPHASRDTGTEVPISDEPPSGMITAPGGAPAPTADLVSPVTPTAPPYPSVGAPAPVYQSGQGRPVGPIPGTTEPETRAELAKMPAYEQWAQKVGSINSFQSAAQKSMADSSDTTLGVPVRNQSDIALINAVKQLASPVVSASTGGRASPDLQAKALEENMPSWERAQDWKQTLLHQGILTDGTRRRLIDMGNQYIRDKETTVKPSLQWAAKNAGSTPEKLWGDTSFEARLLRGESLASAPAAPGAAAPGAAPAAANSGVVILKTGPYAGWKYDARTGTVSQ